MARNVKLGNTTIYDIDTIKLEDADTSGEYDEFYSDDLLDIVNVSPQLTQTQIIEPTSPKVGFSEVHLAGISLVGINASNIKSGTRVRVETTDSHTLSDVTGTFTSEPSATAATASDIALNKAAYVNGQRVVGTNTGGGGITPSGNINITDTQQVNVTNYATAQVVDANLEAQNIRNGVTILGVLGNFSGGGGGTDTSDGTLTSTTQLADGVVAYSQGARFVGTYDVNDYLENITVSLSNSDQLLSPTSPNVGFDTVLVRGVSTSGIVAANIKAGTNVRVTDTGSTTLVNVTGTYTSDATASAGDILSGKSAYVNGSKVNGSMTIYDGSVS